MKRLHFFYSAYLWCKYWLFSIFHCNISALFYWFVFLWFCRDTLSCWCIFRKRKWCLLFFYFGWTLIFFLLSNVIFLSFLFYLIFFQLNMWMQIFFYFLCILLIRQIENNRIFKFMLILFLIPELLIIISWNQIIKPFWFSINLFFSVFNCHFLVNPLAV